MRASATRWNADAKSGWPERTHACSSPTSTDWRSGEAIEHGWTWGELCAVAEDNLYHWEERYAEVFAGTLTWDEWFTVYGAVRRFQQMALTAPRQKRIAKTDEAYLDPLVEKAAAAVVTLIPLATRGGGRHRVRHGFVLLKDRLRPPDHEKLLTELGISAWKATKGEQER
jgi:hypothetical protein